MLFVSNVLCIYYGEKVASLFGILRWNYKMYGCVNHCNNSILHEFIYLCLESSIAPKKNYNEFFAETSDKVSMRPTTTELKLRY